MTALRAERADRVAPADRAPDDRRQRGGRDAARDAQAARALPRARAARARRASSGWSSSSRRSTCPTPPLPEHDDAAAGGRRGRRDLAARRRARSAAAGHGRAGAHLARAALAQAGALRAAQPRPLRPALAALLPLHVADPPLPGPRSATARCWPRSAPARTPPRASRPGGARASGARCASATRWRSSAPPTTSRAASCSRRELFRARLADASSRGEVTGVIGAGAFVAFGDGYEGMLPVRRLRGDWWELNELETMLVGAESGKAIRLGDPVVVQVERVDAPRGRVDLVARRAQRRADDRRHRRQPPGEPSLPPPRATAPELARRGRARSGCRSGVVGRCPAATRSPSNAYWTPLYSTMPWLSRSDCAISSWTVGRRRSSRSGRPAG